MKRLHELTDEQQDELHWLFEGMHVLKLAYENSTDVRDLIGVAKNEYDLAVKIFKESGAEAFLEHFNEEGNSLRGRICYQVTLDLGQEGLIPSTDVLSKFGESRKRHLAVFRLAQGRGNPEKKMRPPYPDEVRLRAEKLIEENGEASYRLLKNRGRPIAPQSLVEDIVASFHAERLQISKTTVRERLREASFRLPVNCVHH